MKRGCGFTNLLTKLLSAHLFSVLVEQGQTSNEPGIQSGTREQKVQFFSAGFLEENLLPPKASIYSFKVQGKTHLPIK